jgi:hypothetical protein
LVLLVLNVGLLGVVVYLVASGRQRAREGVTISENRILTNTITQIAVRKINATNLLAALATRPANWRMLESTNYFTYAINLRNFGCPEETVRDIIIADVVKSYAERRRLLRANAPPPDYWRTSESGKGLPAESAEMRRVLDELDRERSQLIQDVLGVELDVELARYTDDGGSTGPLVSFLPEGKRGSVLALQEKYAAQEQAVYGQSNGLLLDSDRDALRQIQKQREAELAQVLTPEELLAYHLYNSETGNNLRSQLDGFGPTQEEFVKIFQLQKSYDDHFGAGADLGSDALSGVRGRAEQEAAKALEDEIKRTLGPQRYAEYERSQDGDYRALVQLTDRYKLAPEVANNVYAMKAAAERQKLQVESNPNLTDVQRAQMLATVAQQTERNVSSVLGGELFKDYQRGPGQWLNNLYFFDEDNLPPEPAAQDTTSSLPQVPPGLINTLPPGYREIYLRRQGIFPPPPVVPPRNP